MVAGLTITATEEALLFCIGTSDPLATPDGGPRDYFCSLGKRYTIEVLMPIFFHQNDHEINQFAQENKESISLISMDGEQVSKINPNEVSKYFNETYNYFGSYPIKYIFIGNIELLEDLNIINIYKCIAYRNLSGSIILGYNDGGCFSVSDKKRKFQNGAEEIKNWHFLESF